MRKTLLFSCLALSLLATPSYAEVISGFNLELDPVSSGAVSGDDNVIDINASVSHFLGSDSDSTISVATGAILMDLDYDFDPYTRAAELNTVNFIDVYGEPGDFHLSDFEINLSVLGQSVRAISDRVTGYIVTPNPPTPVNNGTYPVPGQKQFLTNLQENVLKRGWIRFDSTVGLTTIDFSQTNEVGTVDRVGYITTTLNTAESSGNLYHYDVALRVPIGVSKGDTVNGVTYDISFTGVLAASGSFVKEIRLFAKFSG